ncbi:hypothetical protein PR048_014905 [Dryococelus australis]|uniref:Uncharacterized protein n=1 Tax=Dryococelus australis TaxID=614101 RepID=A0ABQ9HFH1_9NEOP|nr:hypothetical protein PR048_014905 [Dryococelus australis]
MFQRNTENFANYLHLSITIISTWMSFNADNFEMWQIISKFVAVFQAFAYSLTWLCCLTLIVWLKIRQRKVLSHKE